MGVTCNNFINHTDNNMTQQDKLEIKKAKAYLDGLVKCTDEFGNDDWTLAFLRCWIDFKTHMSLKYPNHHRFGNKYMK